MPGQNLHDHLFYLQFGLQLEECFIQPSLGSILSRYNHNSIEIITGNCIL